MDYLTQDDRHAKPTAITAPPRELADDHGTIAPSFEVGALILRDNQRKVFRLSWGELGQDFEEGPRAGSRGDPESDSAPAPEREALEGAEPDRRRALPLGTYTLLGYRLLRRDEEGTLWHLSASSMNMGQLKVRPGQHLDVEIDESVLMTKRVLERKVIFAAMGDRQSGMSIYRDGTRIPIRYALKDGSKVLATGAMRYG